VSTAPAPRLRVGRIGYINCYPVYGGIDAGVVPLDAALVTGVPSALNARMAAGTLDVSVVSAMEYARDADRYLLLPDLAISCDGPVRSVLLFSTRDPRDLDGARVLVTRSSMTSVALLELLFEERWRARPVFVPSDAESGDLARMAAEPHDARLVIGDAALLLAAATEDAASPWHARYPHCVDLGAEWKAWTGLPFVFAVWVAQRTTPVQGALGAHASLIASRDWGVRHLPRLAAQAALATGVSRDRCTDYFANLDWRLSYPHLAGLTAFFGRLAATGRVPDATSLAFLPAA
jgi:chorismate dehydratase